MVAPLPHKASWKREVEKGRKNFGRREEAAVYIDTSFEAERRVIWQARIHQRFEDEPSNERSNEGVNLGDEG